MRRFVLSLAVIALVIVCHQGAYSKGSPDKITIKGVGLREKINIADKNTLKRFDPWIGQFIDWPRGIVTNPASRDCSYEVSFYIKWKPTDRQLRLFYVLTYVPGHDGGRGFVYLPGEHEPSGYVNRGTIMRDGDDGYWHCASPEWDSLMKSLISRSSS